MDLIIDIFFVNPYQPVQEDLYGIYKVWDWSWW